VRSWHQYQFQSSCSSLHAHSILLCNTAFVSVSHQADVCHSYSCLSYIYIQESNPTKSNYRKQREKQHSLPLKEIFP
jgi:hypothetical protein